MAGITRVGLVIVVSVAMFAGCGRSTSSDAAAKSADGGAKAAHVAQLDPALQPIAHAAADFLDAVLKGDTQRGSARLTPKAMQRIVETGKQFDPPGIENPSFRIIEVRTPSEDHAFVHVLTYTASGAARTEDMCCELRKVENDWRVSGIAYETGPDKPFTLYDFETDRDIPISRQPMPASTGTSPTASAAGWPSPSATPTAQQIPATTPLIDRR